MQHLKHQKHKESLSTAHETTTKGFYQTDEDSPEADEAVEGLGSQYADGEGLDAVALYTEEAKESCTDRCTDRLDSVDVGDIVLVAVVDIRVELARRLVLLGGDGSIRLYGSEEGEDPEGGPG